MSLPESVKLVKDQFALLLAQDENFTKEKLKSIEIHIPPHSGRARGLGMDTTQLFKKLDGAKQYGHGIKVTAIKPITTGGGHYYDGNRSKRQQDVVVSGVSAATERRWRADLLKDHTIVLSMHLSPMRVMKREREVYKTDLDTLLKVVSSPPELKHSL